VRELEGDRSAAEHHEREGGFGGVESVGAAGDQADLVVERCGASLVDPEADCGEDPIAVLADRSPEADERLEWISRGSGGGEVGAAMSGSSSAKNASAAFSPAPSRPHAIFPRR